MDVDEETLARRALRLKAPRRRRSDPPAHACLFYVSGVSEKRRLSVS